MDKKRIFKDYFVYSSGSYISQALGVISGFLLRAFLDPYYMGIWQGLSIIKSYASYTNFGVTRSAAREIAYFRGKGNSEALNKTKNVCFSFTFIMIILTGIALVSFALIKKNTISPYLFWGLITMGCLIVLERTESMIVTLLRSYTKFGVESISKVVTSLLTVIFILFLVKIFKLYGLYIMNIAVFTISIILLMGLSKLRFAFYMNRKELIKLIKVGIPLVLIGFMSTNLINIDRIVVVKMLGAQMLGLYSVALMMGNLVFGISNMAGIVLYPRFQEIYGKKDSKEDVYRVMTKIVHLLWLPLLCLIVGAILLLPYLVKLLIPKYISGIAAMRIFLGGIYFLSLSIFCGHFLITINKQKQYLFICSFIVILNLILDITFIRLGWGIEGIAFATSIGYFFYFLALLSTAIYESKKK